MPDSSEPRAPVVLAIAGSDSGGGAGIQADLKACAALGVHCATAITALTAQNTLGVRAVQPVAADFVAEQIEAVVTDMSVCAVKTGMLVNTEIVAVVAREVQLHQLAPLVVDPVMVSTSGSALLQDDAVAVLREQLFPLTRVVTPNLHEAAVLAGRDVTTLEEMREAARAIHGMGPSHVVVTGGHLAEGHDAVDVLFDGVGFEELRAPRVDTPHTHGTGCSFASAIAAGLALGLEVSVAVRQAKELLRGAIAGGTNVGHGPGPVDTLAPLRIRPHADS